MSPLTNLIILSFLTLIAAAAVVWLMLTAGERITRARDAEEAAPSSRRSRVDVDNDAVRGAKAPRKHAPADAGHLAPPGEATGVRVRPRRSRDEDPFDRFLDPERRRIDDRDR